MEEAKRLLKQSIVHCELDEMASAQHYAERALKALENNNVKCKCKNK